MGDQYAGQGGAYVADASGNRVLTFRTGMAIEDPAKPEPAAKKSRKTESDPQETD